MMNVCGIGESVRPREYGPSNHGRMFAATRLDALFVLLVTAGLSGWFGALHRHGAPSPLLAGTLLIAPLVGGIVLGLRGHVLPITLHVAGGASGALATILPLLGLDPGQGALEPLSGWSAAQMVSIFVVLAFTSALTSAMGIELGGFFHRMLERRR